MPETPWLTIVGIGEDGVDGLSSSARAALLEATLVLGGTRHLALAGALITGERQAWPSPIASAMPGLLARRGLPTVVLASGDPLWFGIGSLLLRHLPTGEVLCLPVPSAFSLACAVLGWSLQEVRTLSLCGRPLATLIPALQPGVRLLVLSADASTPREVRRLLADRGFGASELVLMEALGGPRARVRRFSANGVLPDGIDALNLLGIEPAEGPGARVIPLACGLDDAAFEHDGQLTKREVRAITLSALAPREGELLWDVGSGSGSVAIEWMLRHPSCRAMAIERDPARAARIARNAAALGVPALDIRQGSAPEALEGLPAPDAIFAGGGVSRPGLLERLGAALRPGGRLVANGISLEAEAALLAARAACGGTLARIGIDRLDSIGAMQALRPAMRVTQWAWVKP